MWREGEVELVSLTLDMLSVGCWWKIEVCLSSRQLYTELRSGSEIENSHQHEEVTEATGADEITGRSGERSTFTVWFTEGSSDGLQGIHEVGTTFS